MGPGRRIRVCVCEGVSGVCGDTSVFSSASPSMYAGGVCARDLETGGATIVRVHVAPAHTHVGRQRLPHTSREQRPRGFGALGGAGLAGSASWPAVPRRVT